MKEIESFSKEVSLITQQEKGLSRIIYSDKLPITASIFSLFLFSSCKEYIATCITLAFIPELLFGIFIVVMIIIALISGIIHFISGGNRK